MSVEAQSPVISSCGVVTGIKKEGPGRVTLKPLPSIDHRVLAVTEAYAVLRQVAWLFAQPNPTPRLIDDTRAAVTDYLEKHRVLVPPDHQPDMNISSPSLS